MFRQKLLTILRALILLPLLALATAFVAAEFVPYSEVTQIEQSNTQYADMNQHCAASHQHSSCTACAILPTVQDNLLVESSGSVTPYQFQFSLVYINNHFKPPQV
mgnify:FL=1